MSDEIRLTRDIHNFVRGEMDWESAIDLLGRVSESEEWIDYLLMEMELYECFQQKNSEVEDREVSISESLKIDTVIMNTGKI